MQHKTKKIWLIALLSLLIAALFAASFTYARYYKETGVTGGKYDDTIEFVGANKYLVYTPEELVAAIENGYSYIEIADGAEEPFVITDGVTDVTANLVLDINGHSLVRNSRNPLINVQKDVSVVIVYDSKGSGSFYNPVGSLLQASGGTLTIATGEFTSGPKEGDYVTDVGTTGDVTVYYRNGDRGAEGYTQTSTIQMPAPSGNMYFADGTFENAPFNQFIQDDTFLIYTEETVETPEDATVTVDFSPLCDVASCDFYYYYEKSTEGSGEDKTTTYAVIYGYHDVMNGAEQQITKTGFNEPEDAVINSGDAVIWPYAAVRMTEGEAFIRGGTYENRFGKAQSYGIYARGGSLSVQGENTSFTSVADGVCVRCETTIVDSVTYVPQLNISGTPQFFSVNNETVQVEGGDIVVSSGTATVKADNSTGIYIEGGNLEVASTATLDVTAKITESSTGIYHSPDGVLIDGGSLQAYGVLDVTLLNGKENTYSSDSYDDLVINSFAVRVLNAEDVTIRAGEITNSVGGGVYVGGGTVTLGDESTKTGPTVETTGKEFWGTAYSGPMGNDNSNWKYYKNRSGGHAVEVNGGTLTIYGGLYKAALGNGILVRGGAATVLNGTFSGNDTQAYRENYGGNLPAGPAAYYALNLLGGSVTVWNGTFSGNGSSASVTGVGERATANIYGGTFDVDGQAGFSVYQNVALTFTPNHAEGNFKGSAIQVSAGTTAIAVEDTTDRNVSVTINGGTYTSELADTGKRDGIWYSNPYAKLSISGDTDISAQAQAGIRIVHCPAVEENVKITGDDVKVTGSQYGILYGDTDTQDSEAAVPRGLVIAGGSFTGGQDGLYYGKNGNVVHGLVISGGEFTGTDRSGLYFNVNQWVDGDGNVSISGGTFIGIPKEHTEYYAFVGWKTWYTDGAMGAESEEYDEGLGWSIQIFDLVDQGRNVDYYSNKDTFELTQINHGQWTEDDRQTIALNVTGCKYSKVVVR